MRSPAFEIQLHFELEQIGFRDRPAQILLTKFFEEFRANPSLLEAMRREPRWERYFTDPAASHYRDMRQLGHAINTYLIVAELTQPGVCPSDLTLNDVCTLRLAALVHDLGELGVGDITYDLKSDSAQEAEKLHFEQNLASYLPGFSDAEREAVLRIYLEVTQSKDHENRLVQLFELTERLGYVTTAIAVYVQNAPHIDAEALCTNVFRNHGPKLLAHLEQEPAARTFMRQRLEPLEAALALALDAETEDVPHIDFSAWQRIVELARRAPAPATHDLSRPSCRLWSPL